MFKALKHDNDRLEHRVLSLQSELEVESKKSDHFQKALQLAQADCESIRQLSYEAEHRLRDTLLKESENWSASLEELGILRKGDKDIPSKLNQLLAPLASRLPAEPQVVRDLQASILALIQ
jgi:hypothetical protein